MNDPRGKITVFYDGSCPRCIQDRKNYEAKEPANLEPVEWFDITGQEKLLQQLGIEPYKALTELHVRNPDGEILSELDAYQVLCRRIPEYRLVGWLIGLPFIRPVASGLYRWMVRRRLRKQGRL
ncbi:thiol-disulfide oxidoreductase DCC family protein [Neptuniibacter halophilus]|uniref:thiol-disulfide oxidoreductase DCC family protein n=1 Tax=Neptuniibacter halophilus TaxID=651666 RepID=UPI002573BC1F|nr:DUF393 domain-containing protein [Neptuniibacter halophilus]